MKRTSLQRKRTPLQLALWLSAGSFLEFLQNDLDSSRDSLRVLFHRPESKAGSSGGLINSYCFRET
ncbi:hypothetical protein NG798_23845 [Ancylothrix sp. C2]|nr:hypothetical protein [Ancylothrix sp. D3o]